MKKIRKLLSRLPKLSRTGKIVRNLALLIALCWGFWFLEGGSALTRESALRQMERKLFLAPGETVFESKTYGGPSYQNVFVMGEDYAYGARTSRFSFLDIGVEIYDTAVKADGPALVRSKTQPLGPTVGDWDTVLFCPWGPENAVRAEVTLSAQYVSRTYPLIYFSEDRPAARGEMISSERKDWKKTISASKTEQGFYIIPVSAQTDEEAQILSVMFTAKLHIGDDTHIVDYVSEEAGYRLDFYDENNVLIQSVTGGIERLY